MKIAILGTGYARDNVLPPELCEIVSPGVSAEILPPRAPAESVNQFELAVKEIIYAELALAAEAQGYDAVLINSLGDYGIGAMRSALSIPVVGAGQVSMHLAATLGDRFAIVTIWPRSMGFIYQHLLRDYGLAPRCVSVRHVGTEEEQEHVSEDDNYVVRMRQGESALLDRIVAQCRAAVERDGADTVLLGCTCMSPIAARVAERCGFPIVNPLLAGYKHTEMMLSLGLVQSAVAYNPAATRRRAALPGMVDAARRAAIDATCDVCVIAAQQSAPKTLTTGVPASRP